MNFEQLESAVVKRNFCLGCGACVAGCPVGCLAFDGSFPKLVGKCISCGICYNGCLQTFGFPNVVKLLGADGEVMEIGPYQAIYAAETPEKDLKKRAQDGGAVSALLKTLLEYEWVDGAIVTGIGAEPMRPEARVITSPEEVAEYAGSKYARGPLFPAVMEAVRHYGRSNLALVGLPCQVATLRRIQRSNPVNRHLSEAVKLTIGLFCDEAFEYRFFREVVEGQVRIPLAEVERVVISENKITVYRKRKPPRDIPLFAATRYIDNACKTCPDFSAELADLSVGSAGSPPGLSTVVVRTQLGAEALNFVVKMNGLKARALKPHSKETDEIWINTRRKRERARKNLERLKQTGQPIPVWTEG